MAKMDGEQTKSLQQALLQAVIANAFEYIVGVVYTLQEAVCGSQIHIGSGFCTGVAGRKGWITARHIVDHIRRESKTGNLLGNALIYGSADIGVHLFTLAKEHFTQAAVVYPDSSHDICFVPFPDQAMQKIRAAGIKHINVGRAGSTPSQSTGIYVAYGFAAHGTRLAKVPLMEYVSRGEKHQVSKVQLKGVGMQSVLLKPTEDTPTPSALACSLTLDATAREHTMVPAVELRDAKGMSGGPILYHDYKDASLADFRLCGIQSRQSTTGESVKSMTFCDAQYALEAVDSQLAG